MRDLHAQLEDWFRFTLSASHILKDFPSLIWQEGANQPAQSAVARHAERLQASGRWFRRPWLRWLNRPDARSVALTTLTGHSKDVTIIVVTLDGERIVSGSHDATIKIWDAQTGREIHTLRVHTGGVTNMALMPDGRHLVSVSSDQTIRMWDLDRGEQVGQAPIRTEGQWLLVVTPDGKRIVTAGHGMTIWDAESLQELTIGGDRVHAVVISPDGRRIIAGGWYRVRPGVDVRRHRRADRDVEIRPRKAQALLAHLDEDVGENEARLRLADLYEGHGLEVWGQQHSLEVWDIETAQELFTLEGHAQDIYAVAITPDGEHIVSAGGTYQSLPDWPEGDFTLKIWSARDGQLVRTLAGHNHCVLALAVSPDGERIVSASADRTLRVWESGSGQVLHILQRGTDKEMPMAFTRDGNRLIATTGRGVTIWQLETGEEVGNFPAFGGTAFAEMPDRQRLVAATEGGSLTVFATGQGQRPRATEGHDDAVAQVVFTPAGRRIVTVSADSSKGILSSVPSTLKVWDATSGRLLHTLRGHSTPVPVIAVSTFPDGIRIASAGHEGIVRIWNLTTGEELTELNGHKPPVTALAVSPDGTRLATGDGDAIVRIWDVERGRELQKFKTVFDIVELAFTAGGREIICTTLGFVHIRVADTGEELHSLRPCEGRALMVDSAVIPGTRKLLLATDEDDFKLWDIDSGRELASRKMPRRFFFGGLTLIEDGWQVVTLSWDGTIRMLNAESGEEVRHFGQVAVGHRAVAIDPDGKRLVSLSPGGAVQVWNAQTGDPVAQFHSGTALISVATQGRLICTGAKSGAVYILELVGAS